MAPDAEPMAPAIDGKKTQGMLVLAEATRVAHEKAKEHGFGIVGTCNTSTSTGVLGYYCKSVADQGMISICFAQSPEFVAPAGSSMLFSAPTRSAWAFPRPKAPWCSTWP